jgi:hypothetical protein
MINHSLPAFSSISTRSIGVAVAHSCARLCRLPRVRKANGLDFDLFAGLGKWVNRFHAAGFAAISPYSSMATAAGSVIFYLSSALSH